MSEQKGINESYSIVLAWCQVSHHFVGNMYGVFELLCQFHDSTVFEVLGQFQDKIDISGLNTLLANLQYNIHIQVYLYLSN